jgi:hypothetical protein
VSFHREQYAELFSKISAYVQAHPLPFILVAILAAGIVLGRCSAN